MKKASEASVEEMLTDLSSYEDISQALMVSPTDNGGVFVQDQECRWGEEGSTMHAALLAFGKAMVAHREPDDYELDWWS